jgi:site-specific DNA-methyltransferase (adenine-specific)
MEINRIYNGCCLLESDKIESGSVDLILTDLPFGTMKGINKDFVGYGRKDHDGHLWDVVIDTAKVMETANRILRKNGKMVLFAQDPFSTELKNKAIPNLPFNYSMIWEKDNFANALIAKKSPVNYYEDVLVFSKNSDYEGLHPLRPYFKIVMDFIGLNLKQINVKLGDRRAEHTFYVTSKKAIIGEIGQKADHVTRVGSTQFELCTEETYLELIEVFGIDKMNSFKDFEYLKEIDNQFKKQFASTFNLWQGNKYKSNILKYKKDYTGHHPTQKPILLLEDLIKTFSNKNDLVVDLTIGSGSTAIAALNTKRNYIGIEKNKNYFDLANNRITEHKKQLRIF